MKYDNLECLVRERYTPEMNYGNLGESCAETCRARILGDDRGNFTRFILANAEGYVRHPLLEHVNGWDKKDFSIDAMLALLMCVRLHMPEVFYQFKRENRFFIRGTWTLLSVGCQFVLHEQWKNLNVANIAQGKLLDLNFRWSDDKTWFEKTDGQVQDWLNFICIFIFLRKIGAEATMNQSYEKCMAAVHKYYLEGVDVEPNSQWIVDLYASELQKAMNYGSLGGVRESLNTMGLK